jgi:hypothetical protein
LKSGGTGTPDYSVSPAIFGVHCDRVPQATLDDLAGEDPPSDDVALLVMRT